jgi:hypothetical protein
MEYGNSLTKKKIEQMTDHELFMLMAKNSDSQKKMQILTLIILAVLTVSIIVSAVLIVPKLNRTLEDMSTLAVSLHDIVDDIEISLENVRTMADSITKTVNDNSEALGEAITKISKIDFETLNKAINDLAKIVGPLAKLFGGGKS